MEIDSPVTSFWHLLTEILIILIQDKNHEGCDAWSTTGETLDPLNTRKISLCGTGSANSLPPTPQRL